MGWYHEATSIKTDSLIAIIDICSKADHYGVILELLKLYINI